MSSDVRVALIGYGLAGSVFHAPLIAATPGLDLTAVVTHDPTRRAALARAFPGARAVDDTDALFAESERFDLVVIASPNATHESLARRALAADCNIVVDKPFAATAAGARALVEEAERRGVMITPFQNRRWDGDFLTVRQLVDEGRLGDVHRFESRTERWRSVPKPRWTTETAASDAEGIIYDLGSHFVDQALVLLGPAARVYAEADRHDAAVTVEDDAFIAITHRSGARSHIVLSTTPAIPGAHTTIVGSRGAYVKQGLDPQEDAIKAGARPGDPGWGEDAPERWGTLSDGRTTMRIPTLRGAYEAFYAGVVAALRDGAPPPVDPWDAVRSLAVLEAALESAATSRVVEMST